MNEIYGTLHCTNISSFICRVEDLYKRTETIIKFRIFCMAILHKHIDINVSTNVKMKDPIRNIGDPDRTDQRQMRHVLSS